MSWYDATDPDGLFYDLYLMGQQLGDELTWWSEDSDPAVVGHVTENTLEGLEWGVGEVGEAVGGVAGSAVGGMASGIGGAFKDQPAAWVLLGVLVLGGLVYAGSVVKAFKP